MSEACCSFCGRPDDGATLLIAGPGVFICDGCTDLCGIIVAERRARERQPDAPVLTEARVREIVREETRLVISCRQRRPIPGLGDRVCVDTSCQSPPPKPGT